MDLVRAVLVLWKSDLGRPKLLFNAFLLRVENREVVGNSLRHCVLWLAFLVYGNHLWCTSRLVPRSVEASDHTLRLGWFVMTRWLRTESLVCTSLEVLDVCLYIKWRLVDDINQLEELSLVKLSWRQDLWKLHVHGVVFIYAVLDTEWMVPLWDYLNVTATTAFLRLRQLFNASRLLARLDD